MAYYASGTIRCLRAKHIKQREKETKKGRNKGEMKGWKRGIEVLASTNLPTHPNIADDYEAILGGIHVDANFTQ
jgi:hypothetical protein